ncbi:MAG TPA: Holliday junction resolvase RuvX [Tepidisphaeraceae bacterium]|jgi:putative Holliday junction resolvase|nr:Holliday junction resolvase RuvX [Tepidisphaeraceae bacterium]
MRTLAIDLGTRRVGLAMSDEGARFATPWAVLTVGSPHQARDEVLAIILKEGVERLLVGVPINMDESIGPAARTAIGWARELAALAQLPLVLIDERLSSFEADEMLSERKRGGEKMTRKDRKERLDAIAAAGFLQGFLDGRLPALELP